MSVLLRALEPLAMGAPTRMLFAAVVCSALWLGVWWALS